MPNSVERIALMGGVGDNLIAVDPSVQRGIFLYGGLGHNILMAGSGNDVLVGGSGTSILEGTEQRQRRAVRRRHPGRIPEPDRYPRGRNDRSGFQRRLDVQCADDLAAATACRSQFS